MRAIKITDQDATCVDASWGSNYVGDFAAIPDWVKGDKACHVSRKHGSNVVNINGVNYKAFVDSSPEVALQDALDDMAFDKVDETNKKWWVDTE